MKSLSEAEEMESVGAIGRWKPYPEYKDSGVEWLGEVPEHWDVKKVKYISRLRYGDSLAEEDREIGNIAVYGSNGRVGTHNKANTTSPCIVIGRKGSFGKIVYLDFPCFAIDTTFIIDSSIVNINMKWLFYALACLKLDEFSRDSAIPGLSREVAHNQFLPFINFSEQSYIANYLDSQTLKLDTLIAKKQRLIELLQEKRTSLISQAVTKGLNLNEPMKDSGLEWLGEIPGNWSVDIIKRHFKIDLGKMLDSNKQPENGKLKPYLRAANIYWEGVWVDDVNEMKFTDHQLEHYRLESEDLLVTEGGVTVGRSCIWHGELDECYFQNSINRARPKGRVLAKYLYYWLYALKNNGYIDIIAEKATFGHLTKEKLQELCMTVPPLEEQNTIITRLNYETGIIDSLIVKIQAAITILQEYRAALITSAVTGKIDVRDHTPLDVPHDL